ncbi:MAG: PPOX class F420-dependent enzyme [Thermodesulfobacteriota bacterium]|nr:MAG: PPOX class F420-dependent enzyme [Thermodesulfobacteriota bacterium]
MALDEFVENLITGSKSFASVATLMKDGSPQVSVMWVDSDGENILVNTAEGRVKTDNFRKDKRVALAIVDSENPYRQAMIRGKVVEETHDGAKEHTDKLAKKYLGLDEYPYHQPGDVRVIFKIKPDSVYKIEV